MSDGAAIRRAQVDIRGNRESTRFRILAGTVFSSAVGAVLIGLATEHRSVSWAELLVFGAAAALAGLLSVRSGSTTALSLDMPVLLAAGLVVGPGVGGAIALVSYVDPREWRHEISISRAICNRGQTALSVIGGSLAFMAVGGQLGIWPGSLLAGLLALATDISINYVLVALMTSVRTGVSVSTALSQLQLGSTRLFALMYLSYGLMSVLLAEATAGMGLRGFVAFVVPLALAKGVFEQSRQVLLLRRDSDRKSKALMQATDSLANERRDERQVLAGELHDEVLPPLFKVHLMGQVLRQDLDSGRLLSLDEDLPELLTATEMAQSAIRDVVRGLRGAKLGPGGLASSLRLVAQRLESAGSPRFALEIGEVSGTEAAELLCYQLAREAMSNAARHSQASKVSVTLDEESDWLQLTVSDDGVGFDPSQVDSSTHFGLSLVAERVKATNGIVDVHTCLGGGTTIRALIPKAGYNKTPE
ncbi:MAG TPA: ATP-binding protein [Actinomycetota bacterium]|nr:ATP-binding protein [Actinomycetota bacterium]